MNWLDWLDKATDRAEPAWLFIALALTGFIYLIILLELLA
jgi:hypothetical protein